MPTNTQLFVTTVANIGRTYVGVQLLAPSLNIDNVSHSVPNVDQSSPSVHCLELWQAKRHAQLAARRLHIHSQVRRYKGGLGPSKHLIRAGKLDQNVRPLKIFRNGTFELDPKWWEAYKEKPSLLSSAFDVLESDSSRLLSVRHFYRGFWLKNGRSLWYIAL